MKKEELQEALNKIQIDDSLQKKIVDRCLSKNKSKRWFPMKPLLAACICLVIILGSVGSITVYVEAKEYKEAVSFFNEYHLTMDDLSKNEIKKVYRDITTNTFGYEKTASVLCKVVDGYEINQSAPTSEELETLWNYVKDSSQGLYVVQTQKKSEDGSYYKYDSKYELDDDLGYEIHDKDIFEKYAADDSLLWKVEFSEFWIENYVEHNGTVLVYGETPIYSSAQKSNAWLVMIDENGNVLWKRMFENGFDQESICAILFDESKITVFSRGNLQYLCMSIYDMDGNRNSYHKMDIGNYGIWNAARLGDGYIVQIGSYVEGEYSTILKLDQDGNVNDTISYSSNTDHYFIKDMIEYNGNVYLSAYSVPVLDDDDKNAGGRNDIAAVLNYVFDNEKFDISNKELTKLVRDNYTAVLLVCDVTSNEPKQIYTVKGSLGSKLSVNSDNQLIWNVESITDTYLSLATSSFSIGGASYVYEYTFEKNGVLSSQHKTGEVVNFRK